MFVLGQQRFGGAKTLLAPLDPGKVPSCDRDPGPRELDKEDSYGAHDKWMIGKELWEYVGSADNVDRTDLFSRSKWECGAFLCHCRKHGGEGCILREEGG